MSSTDRIEKKVVLQAPRARVWRALTNAQEFGTWFRVKFDGAFVVGKSITGQIAIPGYEHVTMKLMIERMDAEERFSYRWHPYAMDPKVDYTSETPTLVEFRLAEADGATTLTVVESGFDKIPAGRRDEAFRMNDGGWTSQLKNIARYVAV
ncbi:MAG: SRPBCC family protein [Gemmatimonadaceae bacterium]